VIDVLVIAMAVVVVALVVGSRRVEAGRTSARRADLLATLAPVVGGSVSGDQVLTGRYRGYDVQVCVRTADPARPGLSVGSERYLVQAVELRLAGPPGGQPWDVWRSPSLTGRASSWQFARPHDALARLAGRPPADPDLPDRLRAAGRLDALDRLSPPTKDSLPRIRFTPTSQPGPAGSLLDVVVGRTGDADPTPERFREILDAAVGIAEINAHADPPA
jgi:hypothetical protein